MLNPRQIEAFRWVMLRGSVTGAAAALGVSQPAISRLVRDLETDTGLTLFERRGNHLLPTPEATLLLAEAERYATGLHALTRFAADLRAHRGGRLRVAALPAMAMGFLPRFASKFIEGRERAKMHLSGMPSHLVIDAVQVGQADIGLAAAPPERPGLQIESLDSRAVLAVPSGHRLARRRSVSLPDLAGERVVALSEPTIFSVHTDTLLAGIAHDVVATTPLSGIACALVAEGLGVAIVDPFSVADYLGRGVVAVALQPRFDVRIAMITSAHHRPSALAGEFIEALRAHVSWPAARASSRTRSARASMRSAARA
ncbi:MAG: LysR family transcriptional regulator [Rubrivivax sp.]|nr:LysR family transcriptional regulator [Rubrivivax sp.]